MPVQLAYAHSPLPHAVPQPASRVEGRDRIYRGTFAEVWALLPEFERTAFALGPDDIVNRALDTIVRCTDSVQGLPAVPVGVVAREAAMVTHREVVDALRDAVASAGLDPAAAELEAAISAYGAKMALTVILPDAFHPSGDSRAVRLLCTNSVDCSTGPRISADCCRLELGTQISPSKTSPQPERWDRERFSNKAVRALLMQALREAGSRFRTAA